MACKCGGNRFTAHQQLYVDVVVDGDNDFVENCSQEGDTDGAVYEASKPYGPFTCLECKQVWDELPRFLFYPGLNLWIEEIEGG